MRRRYPISDSYVFLLASKRNLHLVFPGKQKIRKLENRLDMSHRFLGNASKAFERN